MGLVFLSLVLLLLAGGFIGYSFWQNKRDLEAWLESSEREDFEKVEFPTRKVALLYYIGAVFGGCFIITAVLMALQLAVRMIEAGVNSAF